MFTISVFALACLGVLIVSVIAWIRVDGESIFCWIVTALSGLLLVSSIIYSNNFTDYAVFVRSVYSFLVALGIGVVLSVIGIGLGSICRNSSDDDEYDEYDDD